MDSRNSAWCIAVLEGKGRIFKCLVENRLADLIEDNRVKTGALERATEKENLGTLRYLLALKVFSRSNMNACLFTAMKLQNTEIMKLLVAYGANVNEPSNYGETPLLYATKSSVADVTETLLMLGADVNIPPSRNQYPVIHNMVIHRRLDLLKIVRRVCGNVADFKAPSQRERNTPLHLAASGGHVDIVRFLLDILSPDLDIDTETLDDETSLTLATREGHLDVVRLLASGDATVNHRSNGRELGALFAGVASGHFDVVQFLRENGADVSLQRDDSMSVMSLAARIGSADIAEYLAELHGLGFNALKEAVIRGRADIVRILLAHNASGEASQDEASDLLHQAVLHDKSEVAQLLVRHGSDINAAPPITIEGNEIVLMPLLIVAGRENLELVKFLCEHGADVKGVSHQGETALFLAAVWGDFDIVQYLMSEQNANVQTTNSRGRSSAQVSYSECHHRVFRYLMKNGALLF